MPAIIPEGQTITWREQISEDSVNTLITGMLLTKKYYALDELHRDVETFLNTAEIYLNGDLMPLIEPIWQASLPVVEMPLVEMPVIEEEVLP